MGGNAACSAWSSPELRARRGNGHDAGCIDNQSGSFIKQSIKPSAMLRLILIRHGGMRANGWPEKQRNKRAPSKSEGRNGIFSLQLVILYYCCFCFLLRFSFVSGKINKIKSLTSANGIPKIIQMGLPKAPCKNEARSVLHTGS